MIPQFLWSVSNSTSAIEMCISLVEAVLGLKINLCTSELVPMDEVLAELTCLGLSGSCNEQ